MTIRQDPEENEIRALLSLADFKDKQVLEIGCGEGRLTRRYASEAGRVVAIEPYRPHFRQAQADMPEALQAKVELLNVTFEDFSAMSQPAAFDLAMLSWSL
jgi:16S rRNA A1518/A1519 N6-dimethyltransferase RsmA/KsgA/DIM1 with predicted DNA glycosylase/AP lyase activity